MAHFSNFRPYLGGAASTRNGTGSPYEITSSCFLHSRGRTRCMQWTRREPRDVVARSLRAVESAPGRFE